MMLDTAQRTSAAKPVAGVAETVGETDSCGLNGEIPEREQPGRYADRRQRQRGSYFSEEFSAEVLSSFVYKPKDLQVETLSFEEIFVETVRSRRNG